jgi:hypothetical protein
LATEGAAGLVVDVAALQDNSAALIHRQSRILKVEMLKEADLLLMGRELF